MTKHSFVTPASSMRSIRYSLTATGRSLSPSLRLPTGSNSLENAKGFMRLPRPAAGTMPHTSGLRGSVDGSLDVRIRARGRLRVARPDELLQLTRSVIRSVVLEHPLPRQPSAVH